MGTRGTRQPERPSSLFFDRILTDDLVTFDHVLPGQYLLHVRPSAAQRKIAPANVEWGAVRVNVTGEDISGLTLTTSAGFAISGRVTLDGSTTPAAIKGLTLGAREMDLAIQSLGLPPTIANSPVDAAGRFRIVGVRGKVRVMGGGAGSFVKKVSVRGVDVTSAGFDVSADLDGIDVVLTNQATTITGTLKDIRGIGRNDFIVFFPVGSLRVGKDSPGSGRFVPTLTAFTASGTYRPATISPPPCRRCRCRWKANGIPLFGKGSDRAQ